MKKRLLLLIVYATMGFNAPDSRFPKPTLTNTAQTASRIEAGGIIVLSPETYRVVMD